MFNIKRLKLLAATKTFDIVAVANMNSTRFFRCHANNVAPATPEHDYWFREDNVLHQFMDKFSGHADLYVILDYHSVWKQFIERARGIGSRVGVIF